jgi:hypothetical protein
MIPLSGNGNSPYNPDWNIISMGEPVQLVIPNGINWANVNFTFRIPRIETIVQSTNTAYDGSGIILWTLTSTGKSLFASGEINTITSEDIKFESTQTLDSKY